MADEPSAQNAAPSMSMIGQYIRDLSFESPGAPGSIMLNAGNPNFTVGISVNVKKQAAYGYGDSSDYFQYFRNYYIANA